MANSIWALLTKISEGDIYHIDAIDLCFTINPNPLTIWDELFSSATIFDSIAILLSFRELPLISGAILVAQFGESIDFIFEEIPSHVAANSEEKDAQPLHLIIPPFSIVETALIEETWAYAVWFWILELPEIVALLYLDWLELARFLNDRGIDDWIAIQTVILLASKESLAFMFIRGILTIFEL